MSQTHSLGTIGA